MELWELTASEIAGRVRRGELSARDVALSHLGRIDSVNHEINAVVETFADETLAQARAVDEAVARGEDPGPLAGVPVTVKINVDMAGHATTNGLRILRDNVAREDSPPVANLRRAGAVIVGRTNTPAFSLRWFTDNALHGLTLNPHNRAITPGGSSGGASAAVAAGLCAIGHGNDIAGSVRYPAYACGLFGLRPSFGRVPAFNPSGPDRFAGGQLMSVQGPMARSMDDIALSLEAMAAEDLRDPWWVPAPLGFGPFPKRAALWLRPDGMKVVPEVEAALREAARALEDAGWEVEERAPPTLADAYRINGDLIAGEVRMGMKELIERENEPGATFVISQMLRLAPEQDYAALQRTLQRRAASLRAWQLFLADTPLVLCPSSGELPFDQGEDLKSPERFEEIMAAQYTQIAFPALGLPGLAVPTGMAAGRPVGVQLIAGRFREDVLLAAGRDLEARFPRVTPVDPAR